MQTTTGSMNKSATRTAVDEKFPAQDIIEYLKEYARQKPEAAALWCFGVGFVLGWKLKLW